jgi:cytochrome c oxidase subunit 2
MIPSIIQSALHPAGAQAVRIENLWWLMFWVCTVVWVLVMIALGMAMMRGRAGRAVNTQNRTLVRVVATATAVSIVALLGLLTASVVTGRAIASLATPGALVIEVTGYQWWWKVEYLNPDPSLRVTTANELHVPVGRPIAIKLKSADVIHSFWVPNLHGKMDLVPGRENMTWLSVENPGVFRGQCAEYCGLQHAHMAFSVIAEPSDQFEQWIVAQRKPAPAASTPEQVRGEQVVETGPCAMCHTVRGTDAGGRTAPDLTHFATRSTIGAGTAPNTRGYLAGWIANPQHLKPGNKMPATGLSPDDLQAVLAYLETLR